MESARSTGHLLVVSALRGASGGSVRVRVLCSGEERRRRAAIVQALRRRCRGREVASHGLTCCGSFRHHRLYTRPGEYTFDTQWYFTSLTNIVPLPIGPSDYPLPRECKLPLGTYGSVTIDAGSLGSLGLRTAPYVIPDDQKVAAANNRASTSGSFSGIDNPTTASDVSGNATDKCTPTVAVAGTHAYRCADGYLFTVSATQSCATRGGCGLVVDVHGSTMDGDQQDKGTDMRAKAGPRGYVVLQPTVCTSFNAQRKCATAARGQPMFDRIFLVVDELVVRPPVS